MAQYTTDQEFASVWMASRSVIEVGRRTGASSTRQVLGRRRNVERNLGITLPAHTSPEFGNWPTEETSNVRFNEKKDVTLVLGGDKHNLPGRRPQALKAFLHLIEGIKPNYVVLMGDWYDFSSIGRFHRIGWQERPSVAEEIESGTADLKDIKAASPKSKRLFVMGNHDMRFDGFLSNRVGEMEGVIGTSLEDHINRLSKLDFEIILSAVFNDTFIVKHRWHQGIHSGYNDVLKGGKNIATGHDHKLSVRPWTDFSGTRYGIKTGTLSDLWEEVFLYTENNSCDWQPGCVVVTLSQNIIIPTACPIVISNHHRRKGQLNYNGAWYG